MFKVPSNMWPFYDSIVLRVDFLCSMRISKTTYDYTVTERSLYLKKLSKSLLQEHTIHMIKKIYFE